MFRGFLGRARGKILGFFPAVFRVLALETGNLRWGTVTKALYRPARRDAGFFSLCSTSLADLGSLGSRVNWIFANRVFSQYRSLPAFNSWSSFFRQPRNDGDFLASNLYVSTLVKQHLHHGEYGSLDFGLLAPFVQRYFVPSQKVEARRRDFEKQHRINSRDLIAVNIRGTDKWKELPPAHINSYLEVVERAANDAPNAKILVVTDQEQFLRPFEARFSDRLVKIRELPTSYLTDRPIHNTLSLRARKDFGVNFLAVVLLMASAKIVITHTGNTAFWTALYRGHANGFVQLRGDERFGELAWPSNQEENSN